MAEINHTIKTGYKLLFQTYFLCPDSVVYYPDGQAQNISSKQQTRKKIELKYADEDIILKDPVTGKDTHHLKGNVQLQDKDVTMMCDSAHFIPHKNQVTAFSKVHIEQGDTLDLYGDYLFYDGKSQNAFVKGNVELIDKETHLYTDSIYYDVRNKIARYNTEEE